MTSKPTRPEICHELDKMCADILRLMTADDRVRKAADLGLLESMGLIKTAIDNFHGKLKVIYQEEFKKAH
jgi:hypothetical protein